MALVCRLPNVSSPCRISQASFTCFILLSPDLVKSGDSRFLPHPVQPFHAGQFVAWYTRPIPSASGPAGPAEWSVFLGKYGGPIKMPYLQYSRSVFLLLQMVKAFNFPSIINMCPSFRRAQASSARLKSLKSWRPLWMNLITLYGATWAVI